jgi:UDP-N-acetylglucosamine transferase subunit ALG13
MHTAGFLRLVEEMDRIAAGVDEAVVMQIGSTPYRPQAARWFSYATQEEMETLSHQARVIVSHAGAGSILTAVRFRKPLIVMPRRQKHGEVYDDHQLELAELLSQTGVLLVAHEPEELSAKLGVAANFSPRASSRSQLIDAVREAIAALGQGES